MQTFGSDRRRDNFRYINCVPHDFGFERRALYLLGRLQRSQILLAAFHELIAGLVKLTGRYAQDQLCSNTIGKPSKNHKE